MKSRCYYSFVGNALLKSDRYFIIRLSINEVYTKRRVIGSLSYAIFLSKQKAPMRKFPFATGFYSQYDFHTLDVLVCVH